MQSSTRRQFLGSLASITVASSAATAFAAGDDFPSHSIKLVIPQAPGSGADVVGRMLADFMAKDLKATVVVDNRAGANGIIATQMVKREPSDGYTIFLTSVSLVSFNQFLYKNLPYDPFKDFTFVAPVCDAGFVFVASNASGIRNWDDFVKKAKAEPGKFTFGSAGLGNSTHLYTEMIAKAVGVKLRHIPYKSSGPALMAVVSGEADLMTVTSATGVPQLKAGKVVGLAQSGDARSPQLPDLPLIKELAPDVPPLPGWYAVVAPGKLDPKITAKLAASVNHFLADPATRKTLIDQFLFPIPGSPADIQARAEREAKVWGGLIREMKIQLD